MTMNTVKRSIVFEKRRSFSNGVSFRKAIEPAATPDTPKPSFSPDFESTRPSKVQQLLGGIHHALGGLPTVPSAQRTGLVSESDKQDGPLKYIEDAKSSFGGVDLSHFYHWGVAQSRYHRAQLINGDQTNPVLSSMGIYAPKITDSMQRRSAALNKGLKTDDRSSEIYRNEASRLAELDKHDHYVGTLRVIQAYRKLKQGVNPKEIYSPQNWTQEDYDGEKDYRDHPLLGRRSLSTWQHDDPFFALARNSLHKEEKLARGSSASGERGDIRGYSKTSIKGLDVMSPFVRNQASADIWNDHGKEQGYKDVRVPTGPVAFEELLRDPVENFANIRSVIHDEKFSKGSFDKKREMAKIAASKYAEDCWSHYAADKDLNIDGSWFKRLQEFGAGNTGLNLSGIDSLDTSGISSNELLFHKTAHQMLANHKEEFIKYLSHMYTSELLYPSGSISTGGLRDYKSLFGKIEGFDETINAETGGSTENHWHAPFNLVSGPLAKIETLWRKFSETSGHDAPTSAASSSLSDLKNDFLEAIHNQYGGESENGYKEANISKGRQHAAFWTNGFDPEFSSDANGFPLEGLSDKKGFFLQKASDRYQMLHMLLNAISRFQQNPEEERHSAISSIVDGETLGHLRYGKLVRNSKGLTIFPKDLLKSLIITFNYDNFYGNVLKSLMKSSENALYSAQFVLANTTMVLEKPALLNNSEYDQVKNSLKNYLQDEDGD